MWLLATFSLSIYMYIPQMQNLSLRINSTSELYFTSLGHNLSNFSEEVALFFNSSLPLNSQPQVELYLGARYAL